MIQTQKVMFVVPGEPIGKGRPRFRQVGQYTQTYSPKQTVNYESLVRLEYHAQCGNHVFCQDAALGMRITAYKPIPQSTSKRKTLQMLDNVIRPTKKPDWDNIGKIVCDALNKTAFHDDAQIVDGSVIKCYSEQPRIEVEIWEIAEGG